MAVYVENDDGVIELVTQDLTQDVIEGIMAKQAELDGIELSPCGATTMNEFKKLGVYDGR